MSSDKRHNREQKKTGTPVILPDRKDSEKCVKKTTTAIAMIGISTLMALIFVK